METTTTPHPSPSESRHIPALDGVRGLAILLILVDHLMWANIVPGSRILTLFAHIRESSWIGVNLFFALSGFLITGILVGTVNSSTYFKTFYARRTVRIFPLYYGFLFVLFALTPLLHFHWNGWQWYELTYTQNIALWRWNVPLDVNPLNISHFWSLCCEEQFYLIWPFVVYKLRNTTRLITVSLVGCLAVLILRTTLVVLAGRPHFTNPYLAYSFTPACADNLLFGCALALLLRTSARKRVLALAAPVFLTCIVFLTILFFKDDFLDPNQLLMGSLGVSTLGIGASALIAMALTAGTRTSRLFSTPILRFFGRYSYGLYVYHFSIGALSGPLRAWIDGHFHSKTLGVVGGFIILTALSIVAAVLSYHFFENHFLKLKKYFPNAGAQSPAALVG